MSERGLFSPPNNTFNFPVSSFWHKYLNVWQIFFLFLQNHDLLLFDFLTTWQFQGRQEIDVWLDGADTFHPLSILPESRVHLSWWWQVGCGQQTQRWLVTAAWGSQGGHHWCGGQMRRGQRSKTRLVSGGCKGRWHLIWGKVGWG